ncbi:chromate transport protein [Bdellovibrio bacteriovorus]|uniref:Chromate transport protein n=1 Tax=Bdellovibrio bacteriovorus TaxID=959 RepID=A0A162GA17_BDEBC|nr:chromate efflux transporter [Bdellovibrio bacteriovorus]KYG65401.1 chromate transport protein [Bdellovibrio bacteriovorus]
MVSNLIWLFLRLGATSFGGPAAHIAMMEEEFVHRRQWLTREKFLHLLGLTQLIPGPNSTEMAMHIGYTRAGWKGFFLAGLCFILPAYFLVLGVAVLYQRYASLPDLQSFLLGAKSVVISVIALALWRFLKSSFEVEKAPDFFASSFWKKKQNILLTFIFLAALYMKSKDVSEIVILLNCGLISLFISRSPSFHTRELGSLFWVFLKIGSLLFGSGYVLLSFLKTELIEKRSWITETQLLDGILVGQFTPGPVFTTATFLGYLTDGFAGSLVATVGIFLPAFVFVALTIPFYSKLESSFTVRMILNGVVVGSLGLLTYTLIVLGRDVFTSGLLSGLALIAFLALIKTKTPSSVLILLGGSLSYFFSKI